MPDAHSTKKDNVYLAIGGNFPETATLITQAIEAIQHHPHIWDVTYSPLYETEAVSDIPQPNFLNGAIGLKTDLTAAELFAFLEELQHTLGKRRKPKNAPRPIDIDILFFGLEFHDTPVLEIPHPRWRERFFVLRPLSDLTDSITFPINAEGDCETVSLDDALAHLV